MNPFGSVTDSIPGVGGGGDSEDSGVSKEEAEEQERFVILNRKMTISYLLISTFKKSSRKLLFKV